MNNPQIIMSLFAWVPYVLVSWGYSKLTHDSFWLALGVLLVIRIFFSIIETLGSVLTWRLYGRAKMVEINLSTLRNNNFPKRQYAHDDFGSYLSRIENDYEKNYPEQLKAVARQWDQTLVQSESFGILLGMRMHAAAEEALNIYSPKAEAPIFGDASA